MHHSVHALFWDTTVLILIQKTVRRCWAQQSVRFFLHKQHSTASVCYCSWLEQKAQRATLERNSAEHRVGAGTLLTPCYKLKKKWTLCHWDSAVRAKWWNVCNVRHSLQSPNVFLIGVKVHTFKETEACRVLAAVEKTSAHLKQQIFLQIWVIKARNLILQVNTLKWKMCRPADEKGKKCKIIIKPTIYHI